MKQRFTDFLTALAKHKSPESPAGINRSHFLNATDPIESRLAEALQSFPPCELDFLIMSFGLDSHNPKSPQVIASAMGVMLLQVLDRGTGAELRLRNRKDTRALIEAIAGQEVAALKRFLDEISIFRNEQRKRAATDLWFYSRRPLRRLAMSTAMEGGFGAFLALVREGHEWGCGRNCPDQCEIHGIGPHGDARSR